MVETIMFYAIAALVLTSAVLMISVRNIYHSALYLALTLFGVAAVFVMLNSYFLAGIQVLIYIGAVVVLAIFVINLTRRVTGSKIPQHNKQVIPAVIVSALTVFLMISAILKTQWGTVVTTWVKEDNTALTGTLLLGDFVIPFEVVSVLLLASLLGAVVIVSKDQEAAE
jgi:NADH:ubiquinone oxidoreductase subunit 6 (subunit J)